MNEFKQKHIENKNAIIACLKDAERFFVENEMSYEAENTRVNREKLENGEFSVSVVGEFSAGKSTFLNALMGEHILPSFSAETTATINFLRHKDQAPEGESGVVYYKDGREKKLDKVNLETIKQYVSTVSTDEDVAQSVDHLDLFLESRFLEDNVTLVDTPGLNGIAEGHRETTIKQIQQTSAGIFLFKANQPGSRSDFEFLTELRKRIDGNSVILVLNRIDEIKESEGETVESVVNKLKENYKKVYPEATTLPEIWPVAAYPALIARSHKKFDYHGEYRVFNDEEKSTFEKLSRMKAFEDRLWKFLTQGEKTKQELLAPIRQLESVLLELKNKYNAQLNGLNGTMDQGDIESQKLELRKSMDILDDELKKLTADMAKDVQEAEKDFFNEIKTEVKNFKKRFIARISDFESIDEIDPDFIRDKINNELAMIAEEAYENYGDAIRSIIAKNATIVTSELNESLSAEMNIKLNTELELPEVKSGIDTFLKKETELREEIERLRIEIDDNDINILQAAKNEDRIDSIERELKELKKQREKFEEDSILYTPEIEKRQERKESKVGWFIFKKTKVEWIDVVDDSKRIEYQENVNKTLAKRDKEIAELTRQLDSMPRSENLEIMQHKRERKNALLSERRAEMERMQREFSDKIRKDSENALKKQKIQIEAYLDNMTKEYESENKKRFRNERASQLALIEGIIAGSVKKKLELKRQELETLENKFNIAVSERNQMIAAIEEQSRYVGELISRAAVLEGAIDSIKTDSIKDEEI